MRFAKDFTIQGDVVIKRQMKFSVGSDAHWEEKLTLHS